MTFGPITKDASTWMIGLMQVRVGPSAAYINTITPVLSAANSIGALGKTTLRSTVEFFRQMSGFPKTEDGVIPLSETAALEISFKEATPYNFALARGIDPTQSLDPVAFFSSMVTPAGSTDDAKEIAVDTGAGWGVIDEEWVVIFNSETSGKIFGKNTGYIHSFANLTDAMSPVHDTTLKYFTIPASFFTGTWAADDVYTFYTSAGGGEPSLQDYSDPHAGSIGLGGMSPPANIRVEALYTFPNAVNTITVIFPRAQAVATLEVDANEDSEAVVPVVLESKNAGSSNADGNAVWDSMPLGRVIWA
jgi:hypothetical protein